MIYSDRVNNKFSSATPINLFFHILCLQYIFFTTAAHNALITENAYSIALCLEANLVANSFQLNIVENNILEGQVMLIANRLLILVITVFLCI